MMINDVLQKSKPHKRRKRVGRGIGSGTGKTSARGHKGSGQHSTTIAKRMAEGGQMALFRRLPKRGFSNANFRVEYQVVNIKQLQERFEAGTHITPALLEEAGLIRRATDPVKILGTGELNKKFSVEATAASATAAAKIQAAGGNIKLPESTPVSG